MLCFLQAAQLLLRRKYCDGKAKPNSSQLSVFYKTPLRTHLCSPIQLRNFVLFFKDTLNGIYKAQTPSLLPPCMVVDFTSNLVKLRIIYQGFQWELAFASIVSNHDEVISSSAVELKKRCKPEKHKYWPAQAPEQSWWWFWRNNYFKQHTWQTCWCSKRVVMVDNGNYVIVKRSRRTVASWRRVLWNSNLLHLIHNHRNFWMNIFIVLLYIFLVSSQHLLFFFCCFITTDIQNCECTSLWYVSTWPVISSSSKSLLVNLFT